MTAPKSSVIQIEYSNPDAENKLLIPVQVICNTSENEINQNVSDNSAKPLKWLHSEPVHKGIAVLVGGGASIKDEIDTIISLQDKGATIFAMNAASQWLNEHGIEVDFQCIADAQEVTSRVVDHTANAHIIASQVHPTTMDSIQNPIVWHVGIEGIESLFPAERVMRGGYVILGGGASVGNSAMCVAYAKGFRDLRVFGFDSCHKDGRSHAYQQNWNATIPTTKVTCAGKEYVTSVTMKTQAEKFQFTARHLQVAGCSIRVYGEGLLQTMYNMKSDDMTEQEKYQALWEYESYRDGSPGECVADFYLSTFNPEGTIIDFGCGTGRAGVKFVEAGNDVLLIDFTDNCRDEEALSIPFMQADLTNPMKAESLNGFCTDVMEHIPPKDVDTVIKNIMACSKNVFFQIATVDDIGGALIGATLHLTVKPHKWWYRTFKNLGFKVDFEESNPVSSIFYVRN